MSRVLIRCSSQQYVHHVRSRTDGSQRCLRTLSEPLYPFSSDKFLLYSSCFSYPIDLNSDPRTFTSSSQPSRLAVPMFDINALLSPPIGPFELADLVGPDPAVMTSFDFSQIDTNSSPVIRLVARTFQDSNEHFRRICIIATPVQYT